MTYAETRDKETLRLLTPAIDAFIAQCQKPLNPASACPRQTLFFFPGGMASRLTRATKKFVDGAAAAQTFKYKTVWVTPGTPFGGARDLAMYRDSAGTFRDKGNRIIIADAALSLDLGLAECTPHDGLISWCQNNNVDLFVFPWDWRRRLDETATFFVGKFLPFFQDRVQKAGCPNPLAQFALVGHSFGGMVVNLILRGNDPMVANVTHAITVATPFYGYSGQLHRWFEGEPLLNAFGLFEQDMMEVIASLPGLYTLHFLDEVTYNSGTGTALGQDPDFPLTGYPSMDATGATVRADAYNPQTNGSLVRYPAMTGFDRTELDYGRVQFQLLASPMDPTLLQKFYNIRGVRTEADDETPTSDTPGGVKWDWILTSFDATDPSPIIDSAPVPGDDTQPAWTARLVTNAPARCITVKASNIDHMFMMNHASLIDAIQGILCPGGAAVSVSKTPQPKPASDEEIVEFLAWLSENSLRVRNLETFKELQTLLPRKFHGKLPGIARRFMSDVMKRPGPKGLRGPGPEGDAGGGESPGPPPPRGRAVPRSPLHSTGPKPAARRPQRKPPKKSRR